MKKGFTLIELLAVIVILAILALIVTPIISGVITNAKISAAARSLEGYAQAVELAEINYQSSNGGEVTMVLSELTVEAKSKSKVEVTSIVIEDSGIVSSIKAIVDGFTCTYSKDSGATCSVNAVVTNMINNSYHMDEYKKEVKKVGDKYNFSVSCYLNDIDCPDNYNNDYSAIVSELSYLDTPYYNNFFEVLNSDSVVSINFYNDGRIITGAEVLDVSKLNDNSVIMYYKENSEDSSNYDVSFVSNGNIIFPLDSSYFFDQLKNVGELNFNNSIDTSSVINMSNMFNNFAFNSSLSLDLSNFNTSSVTNMSNMFNSVGYLNNAFTLDLGDNFNTSNVTDMSNMFMYTGYNSNTFTLNLGNYFYTSNVTNMGSMFYWTGYNSNSFTLDLKNNFDTRNVTNMESMFTSTGYLNPDFTLNLGTNFKTSKVTNMESMFDGTGYNSTIFTLNLGNYFDTRNVTNMERMFYCTGEIGMSTLNLGSGFISIAENNTDMFTATGTTDCVISVPSAIFNDTTHLKLNSTSSTLITRTDSRTFTQL